MVVMMIASLNHNILFTGDNTNWLFWVCKYKNKVISDDNVSSAKNKEKLDNEGNDGDINGIKLYVSVN